MMGIEFHGEHEEAGPNIFAKGVGTLVGKIANMDPLTRSFEPTEHAIFTGLIPNKTDYGQAEYNPSGG